MRLPLEILLYSHTRQVTCLSKHQSPPFRNTHLETQQYLLEDSYLLCTLQKNKWYWMKLHPTCLFKGLGHHPSFDFDVKVLLVWTDNPPAEKPNTGARAIHLARLNLAWLFLGFFLHSWSSRKHKPFLMLVWQRKHPTDSLSLMSVQTKNPSVCGRCASPVKDAFRTFKYLLIAVSLSSSRRFKKYKKSFKNTNDAL